MSERNDAPGWGFFFFTCVGIAAAIWSIDARLEDISARVDRLEATHGYVQAGGYIPDTERPCYPFCPEEPAP